MRNFFLVFVITIMTGFVSVNAQGIMSKIKFGIKAEANYSNFILSDMSGVKSKMGLGTAFGTSTRFNISDNFAIQEDCLLTYATSDISYKGVKDTYQYLGMETPIYLMGQWNTLSGGRIYGGAGPYFSMGFKARLRDSDLNLYKKIDGEKIMKRMAMGASAQLGYEFNFGLHVNAGYKIGFTNVLDAWSDDSRALPQMVSLGIGYQF